MDKLCIVVPCYNEEEALPYFVQEIKKTAEELFQSFSLNISVLLIDDGSQDRTLQLLRSYAEAEDNIGYLSFSRNFGKESAIYAGLQHADGDYVVIMDADLQHPPAMLAEMYQSLQSGEFDSAAACRSDRKGEPPVRSFFARRFYRLINRISDADLVDGASDFRMMKRKMVDAIVAMGEYNRFSKGIFGWVGFRTKWIPYQNVERIAGQTKWSFWKLFQYSLQGIIAFSTVPLGIASVIGVFTCVMAFLMGFWIVIKTLLFGDPVAGWPTLACMIVFMGGLQLFCTGILGQYLAKTYMEAKHRPIYIIAEQSPVINKNEMK